MAAGANDVVTRAAFARQCLVGSDALRVRSYLLHSARTEAAGVELQLGLVNTCQQSG
jgi:hypothetical protein